MFSPFKRSNKDMSAIVLDLKKSQGIVLDLSKEAPGLTLLRLQTSWKEKQGFDLDLVGFFLNDQGKIESLGDVNFFNNMNCYGGALVLQKDQRDGGVEVQDMNLSKVPANRSRVDLFVTIFEGTKRNQSFMLLADAKYELIDAALNKVIQTYTLQDFTTDNALHVGSLERDGNGKWSFTPVGTSATIQDINEIAAAYQ